MSQFFIVKLCHYADTHTAEAATAAIAAARAAAAAAVVITAKAKQTSQRRRWELENFQDMLLEKRKLSFFKS